MANIKVDHSQFERTASAIETYINNHKTSMNSIDQSVNSLGSSWQGNDYTQLKKEWQEIINKKLALESDLGEKQLITRKLKKDEVDEIKKRLRRKS